MTETAKFDFPSYMREEFETVLEKTNKKLRKIKGATEVTILEETYGKKIRGRNAFDEPIYVDFTTVEVTLPASVKHKGFEFLGTVSHKDGVKTIFTIDPKTNLADVEQTTCDHCKSSRKRNHVHVFLRKGEFFTVGSTCCKEYFGLDLHKALTIFRGFITLISNYDNDDYCRGIRGVYGHDVKEVIHCTLLAYNANSAYSKGDYYGGIPSTAGLVKNAMDGAFAHENRAELAKAARVASTVITPDELLKLLDATYGKLDPKANNFNSNIVNALYSGSELRGFIPAKVTGLWIWAIYNALNKEAKAVAVAKAPKKVNAHIGKIGDKVTITGEVKLLKNCGSYAYNSPVSVLVTIDTPDGQVKTFSTAGWVDSVNVGDTITLNGTVKKHEDWKGFKSTMLTRTGIPATKEQLDAEAVKDAERKEQQKVRAKVRKKLALAKNDIIVVPKDAEKEEVFKDEVTIGDYTFVKEYTSRGTCDSGSLRSYFVKDGERISSPLTNCNVFPWGNNVSGYWKKWTDNVLDIVIEYHPEIVEAV